jgi:hypothetical protein
MVGSGSKRSRDAPDNVLAGNPVMPPAGYLDQRKDLVIKHMPITENQIYECSFFWTRTILRIFLAKFTYDVLTNLQYMVAVR